MLVRSKGAPTLKEQLISIIKSDIETGVYKEGELLPREIDYEEKYWSTAGIISGTGNCSRSNSK